MTESPDSVRGGAEAAAPRGSESDRRPWLGASARDWMLAFTIALPMVLGFWTALDDFVVAWCLGAGLVPAFALAFAEDRRRRSGGADSARRSAE